MEGQTQTQITPEELLKALKIVGRVSNQTSGFFEVWDDNEVILRSITGIESLLLLDLSEETPESLIERLKPHLS